jgi:hypothetical protein
VCSSDLLLYNTFAVTCGTVLHAEKYIKSYGQNYYAKYTLSSNMHVFVVKISSE